MRRLFCAGVLLGSVAGLAIASYALVLRGVLHGLATMWFLVRIEWHPSYPIADIKDEIAGYWMELTALRKLPPPARDDEIREQLRRMR